MSELDQLLENLDTQRRTLVEQVRGLGDEAAGRRPRPGEWSAKEQLCHLAETERRWIGWALHTRDNPGCQLTPGPPNPEGFPTAQAHPLSQLLAELERTRQESVAVIHKLSPEELGRRGTHPTFGEMTVLQMLRALYRHDRMHLEQVQGKEPSFRPRQG